MNDKAIENRPSLSDEEIIGILYKYLRPEQVKPLVCSRTKDGIDCDYLTVGCTQLVNAIISRVWLPVAESDTRGEVTAEQSSWEWAMQQSAHFHKIGLRINDDAPKEKAWFNERAETAEASNLLLREENERLRAELAEMTQDRNDWASDHEDDCPNKTLLEFAEAELATLRASASSEVQK